MKRIPLFLVLSLIFAWWYTSWYWYTCNIKWACQPVQNSRESSQNTINNTNRENQSSQAELLNQSQQEEADFSEESWTWENVEVQKLSRSDVLVWDSYIPQAPVSQQESESASWESVEVSEVQEIPASWETIIQQELEQWSNQRESISWSGSRWETSAVNTQSEVAATWNLCTNPLRGTISSWWSNDRNEVLKLEAFLIANAYLSNSDGVYGNDDFEAVKTLQLDYKEQMLDPWGIDTPTWFVGKTTIATINSIWCKN